MNEKKDELLQLPYGHWTFLFENLKTEFEQSNPKPLGFIYLITNCQTGRKYIGRKQIFSGNRNERKKNRETDWKIYCGSCKQLLKDIEQLGKHNFKFEIIEWCFSKFELKYQEAKYQLLTDALLKPNEYYNGILQLRLARPKQFSTLLQHAQSFSSMENCTQTNTKTIARLET